MWGEIRALLGGDYDKERLVAVDCDRASINASTAAFPQAAVAGRYFHIGQSRYREVDGHGISQKYLASEEFRLRAKQLSALAPLPIEEVAMWCEHLENSPEEDEQGVPRVFRSDVHREASRRRQAEPVVRPFDLECGEPNDSRIAAHG